MTDPLTLTGWWVVDLSLLIAVLAGLIIVIGTCFGVFLHKEITDHCTVDPSKSKRVIENFRDFFDRTNEFWMTYGQIILAIFIVTVIAILLLTKTINPDAGLPILSAISGFAIAKGASTTRSSPESKDSQNPSHDKPPEAPKDGGSQICQESTDPNLLKK